MDSSDDSTDEVLCDLNEMDELDLRIMARQNNLSPEGGRLSLLRRIRELFDLGEEQIEVSIKSKTGAAEKLGQPDAKRAKKENTKIPSAGPSPMPAVPSGSSGPKPGPSSQGRSGPQIVAPPGRPASSASSGLSRHPKPGPSSNERFGPPTPLGAPPQGIIYYIHFYVPMIFELNFNSNYQVSRVSAHFTCSSV